MRIYATRYVHALNAGVWINKKSRGILRRIPRPCLGPVSTVDLFSKGYELKVRAQL
jgi:hypothetical protein